MITGLLHRLVARPRVYDLVQRAVGAAAIRRRLAELILPFRSARIVLDIGGGTGLARALWSVESRYICLDIDPVKLSGYRAKDPRALAMLADATKLPIRDKSVDAVVCTSVTHHLLDGQFETMFAEGARVLKPDGRFILMDAIWAPYRLPGRLLWRFDRGSFPRGIERLRSAMGAHFDLVEWDEFAILHRYVLGVGVPRSA